MAEKITRRKFLKGAAATALALAIPHFAKAGRKGKVFFELGPHDTPEQARDKIQKRLDGEHKHFVLEHDPYSGHAMTSATAKEYLDAMKTSQDTTFQLSAMMTFGKEFPESSHPYVAERNRLIIRANQEEGKPRYFVHLEPASLEAAKHYYDARQTISKMQESIKKGDGKKALLHFQRYALLFAMHNVEREKVITKTILDIHKEHPECDIIVDLGPQHDAVANEMRRKGLQVSSRIVQPPQTPAIVLTHALIQSQRDKTERPKQEAFERAFLQELLVPEMGSEKASEIINEMNHSKLANVMAHLKKRGKNLTERAAQLVTQ
ncbi:MAG TPA: twin-arginine translocation signal domain-containing protein [Candidatus Norongarragalinales archaeon]|jgi:hypothetical protein|nr:twin-arginine translocation signal domain-containing protein [Candidatus Norongarragalinales archaeon]